MTAIEVQNFQEAFILTNSFSFELSLGLALALTLLIALLWLFSPEKVGNDHD